MFGRCCTLLACKGQAVIALSSGEAEYYGLTIGMLALLGLIRLAEDWNVVLHPRALLDASTGIAIGSRRGLGQLKHIDTVFLWCQEKVSSGVVQLCKRNTKEMLADMITKPLASAEIVRHMSGMNFHFRTGRHALAYTA